MAWVKRYKGRVTGTITLPFTFTHNTIAVLAEEFNPIPTHRYAGYLFPVTTDGMLGEIAVGQMISIPLGQLMAFKVARLSKQYKLRFKPHKWVKAQNLTIYESVMAIYPETDFSLSSTLESSTISVAATAVRLLPASTSRREFEIINPSTSATIYLGYDNTVTTASRYQIPPSKAYTHPIMWSGEVYAISNKTTATAVEVRTYS